MRISSSVSGSGSLQPLKTCSNLWSERRSQPTPAPWQAREDHGCWCLPLAPYCCPFTVQQLWRKMHLVQAHDEVPSATAAGSLHARTHEGIAKGTPDLHRAL